MKKTLIVLLILSLPVPASLIAEEPLTRIHFGSCIKQDNPMPLLQRIVADKPELFLFLGDNIYADTDDMDVMRAKYARLAADPGFAMLRTICPVMATWDDHDYGINDSGAEYPKKAEAQQIFLNFWGEAPAGDRRNREGIYDSRVIGPEGRRVQIIMLDGRYFRSPLKAGERRVGGRYYPDPNPQLTMLGKAQWEWLERQLREPAELRLLVSGIQFVAESAGQETWSNLPTERRRMIDLIASTKAGGVLFLSGDRHWSELSVQRDEGAPYPLYDLTSSSLNQRHPRGTPTENRFRDAEMSKTYHRENFGVVEIDWEAGPPTVTLKIVDADGGIPIEKQIDLPGK